MTTKTATVSTGKRRIQVVVSEADYQEILAAALEQSRHRPPVPVSLSAYCAEKILGRPSLRPQGRPRKESELDA